jgi:hypothetical protein
MPQKPLAVLRSTREVLYASVLKRATWPLLERRLTIGLAGAIDVPCARLAAYNDELKGVHVAHEFLRGVTKRVHAAPVNIEEGKVGQLRKSVKLKEMCQNQI